MRFLVEDLETDSNGNMLSPVQLIYFSNSKIRDDKGQLLVCYHGTDQEFTEFIKDPNHKSRSKATAFWFTPSKELASTYHSHGKELEGYLKITKPFVYDCKGNTWNKIPVHDNGLLNGLKKIDSYKNRTVFTNKPEDKEITTTTDCILDVVYYLDGRFDGIVFKNIIDYGANPKENVNYGATTDFVIFDSNQFKQLSNKFPSESRHMHEDKQN